SRGMERAILSVGEEKGEFRGIKKSDGSTYELIRDTDRPIRLTVQFYMCTDTAHITDSNLDEICNQLRHIYNQGLSEGSLVVDYSVPKPGLPIKIPATRPTATTKTTPTYQPSHLNGGML